MTEEEAKAKWCPFTRTSYSTLEEREQGGVNRLQGPSEVSCIASACMAWRWGPDERIFAVRGPDDIARQTAAAKERGLGYCGLAGRP